MTYELEKGDLVILKRPLADLLCQIVWVEGSKVSIRYLDEPFAPGYNVVSMKDIRSLGGGSYEPLPPSLEHTLETQREIGVPSSPHKTPTTLTLEEQLLRKMADHPESLARILMIMKGGEIR